MVKLPAGFLDHQAMKEVYEAERNKNREQLESTRRYIKRMMKMIKEMMEISRKSFMQGPVLIK